MKTLLLPQIRQCILSSALALPLLSFSTPLLHAGDIEWSGSGVNTDWTLPGNWTGNAPPTSTDHARFTNVTNRIVNIDTAQTIEGLGFADDSSYTFSGSDLTLSSSVTTGTGAALHISGGGTHVFNNNLRLTGSGGTGTSSFMNLPQSFKGSVEFKGNVTVTNNLGTVQAGATNTVRTIKFSGDVSIGGGAGTFTWRTSSSGEDSKTTLVLSGSNSWGTFTSARAGTIFQLGSDHALPSSSLFQSSSPAGINAPEIQALGGARSFNVTLEHLHDGTTPLIFSGEHNITFSGGTILSRSSTNTHKIIEVDGIRTTLSGNWTIGGSSGSYPATAYTFDKTGSGTLVMGSNGTSTVAYRGATTVKAGTLLVNALMANHNATDPDSVTVHTGAALGGIGTIGRATTLQNGAIITAGDSAINSGVGTLTFSNTLTAQENARFTFDLNGTASANDLIVSNGTLNLGTGNTFTFDFTNLGLGEMTTEEWVTIWQLNEEWGTNWSANVFIIGALSGGLSDGEFRLSGNDLQVRFVGAIPETSTSLLLLVAAGLLVVIVRQPQSLRR